ncbi:MAG: peptidyl-prolyl cis-trans isomerase [Neisseriaceae bacterium]|nr:peptidyl-prolyl cis-trans isomerase [Neisseriaceae bacterium]
MKKSIFLAIGLTIAINANATVFATVNGEKITEAEISPIVTSAGVDLVDFPKLNDAQKKSVIDKAIEFKLLFNEAKKSGIEKKDVYKTQIEYAKNLAIINAWQAQQVSQIKISDKKLQDFYNQNKSDFVEPELVKIKHIIVNKDEDAKNIITQLKGLKGEELTKKFSEIAVEKSIEPIAKQSGGDLPPFPRKDVMVEEVSNAAFAMKKGEISKTPVKSKFGYHVILKEDQIKQRQVSFIEAKPFIENLLRQQEAENVLRKASDDLRKKAKIEYK